MAAPEVLQTGIDTGAIVIEAIRAVGPVGVLVLAALWWKRGSPRDASPPDQVVQLLTEIRDLLKAGEREHEIMREDAKRLELRLATMATPIRSPVVAEAG
jgi:hypothetical protein